MLTRKMLIFTLTLGAAGVVGIIRADEDHEERVEVDPESIDVLVERSWDNAEATKGEKLTKKEAKKVKENLKHHLKQNVEETDGVRMFNKEMSHVVNCSEDQNTPGKRRRHLKQCPT